MEVYLGELLGSGHLLARWLALRIFTCLGLGIQNKPSWLPLASCEGSSAAKDDAIHRVVVEVFEKAKQQKLRIEAKSMPKDQPVPETPSTDSRPVKGPPAVVLEQRAKEAAAKEKVKLPPKKLDVPGS